MVHRISLPVQVASGPGLGGGGGGGGLVGDMDVGVGGGGAGPCSPRSGGGFWMTDMVAAAGTVAGPHQ